MTDERSVRLEFPPAEIAPVVHDPRPGLTGERLVVIILVPIADEGDR
jgi:hypothetical protein